MIIGLNGFKGSGKDTAARYIADNYGFEVMHFAALLKQSASALFGIEEEGYWDVAKNDPDIKVAVYRDNLLAHRREEHYVLTAREFLQRYGTESHREIFGIDFWVDALGRQIPEGADVVIADARFEDELTWIRDVRSGITVRIERPGLEGDGHASEVIPPWGLLDDTVWNDGTVEELYAKLDELMEHIPRG